MANIKTLLKSLLKNVILFIAGVFMWLFFLAYLILNSPILVYRWIVTKIIVPVIQPNVGKVVNVTGQVIAAEFIQPDFSPRSTVVVNLIFEGHISLDELSEAIETRWIKATTDQGTLKYPELQQYLIYLLGFMFWKQDTQFDLKNHIHCHHINDNSDQGSERSLCQLVQHLVNKPYVNNRSPWEVHLVHNYMNSSLHKDDFNRRNLKCSEMSVVILRIHHHSMGDGFALMHLLVEQLCNFSLKSSQIATPTKVTHKSFVTKVTSFVMYPITFLCESGNLMMTIGWRRNTPFHIPDSEKSWTMLYSRSSLIPMSKIKFIKNTFGVSFASVVNSCLSAGLAKILAKLAKDKKEYRQMPDKLVFASPFPTSRPKKLRLEASGIAFMIPVKPELNAVDRLHECERQLQRVKSSPMPLIASLAFKGFSSHLAPVSKFILRNRYVATGVSSFPGPQVQVTFNQKRALAVDFVAGLLEGDAGVGFMALSFAGSVRISATAEKTVLSRDQLNELIDSVCKEIDVLYDLALNTDISASHHNLLTVI